MNNTLLPTGPETAALITEVIPLTLVAKAGIDPTPSNLSFGFDGVALGLVAIENANNVVSAVKKGDIPTAALALGACIASGLAADNHRVLIKSKQEVDWNDETKAAKLRGAAAVLAFTVAQIHINRRLGK